MCGIFAFFLKRSLTDKDVLFGQKGIESVRHRGPDDCGFWIDREKGVFIGHSRLSIIDPTQRSHQPFRHNGLTLSFNGEIYNYKRLKQDIERNSTRFTSDGDTETLLRTWERHGEKTFDLLDGMFAFVIYDGTRVTLAVDPFGEKPLFYAETTDGLFVCSELYGLAGLLGLKPAPTDFQLAQYLSLGYFPIPATAYREIKQVPPASFLIYEDGKFIKEKQYWSVPFYSSGDGPVKSLTELELDLVGAKLTESLSLRLTSDVPLCLFLSGGIDSSLVAALAKRELNISLHCATVEFGGDSKGSESEIAKETANLLGLEHEIIMSSIESDNSTPQDIVELFGQPCDSITIESVRKMTSAFGGSFKVGLTGMGGDEIFLGYGKHHHFFKYRFLYESPEALRMLAGALLSPLVGLSKYLLLIKEDFCVDDRERYLAFRNYPAMSWLRKLPGYVRLLNEIPRDNGRDYSSFLQRHIIASEMPNGRLLAMDLGGMRSSMELRTPFLSRPLVETIAQLDFRAFMAYGQKDILRRLLCRYLPKSITELPKRGFQYPPARLLQKFTGQGNSFPGISEAMVKEVLRNVSAGKGWESIAVRLALLKGWL